MALADLLRKPIVPIMLCATPWPPPGKKPSSRQDYKFMFKWNNVYAFI